jgi:hypothetical protein
MEAVEVSSTIKKGSWFMSAMGVYTLVMSVMWVFVTEVVFVSDFAGYTGQTYAEYLAAEPVYAEMYMITKKLVGAMIAVSSTLMILVNHYSYRKGERWSWYALLIAGALLWGTLIGYLAPSVVTFVVGAALWIIGITLPAKEILGSGSSRQND